jgi:hypothetical protein
MKGDFSRLTFKKLKHFAAVLSQQGRVLLDSEKNEDEAIATYLRETSLIDIIGPSGVPLNDENAFRIASVTASDLTIQAGHMYVDGILVEADAQASFTGQPYCAADGEAVSVPAGTRTDLVYLEVWQQHVTALEDPDIREKALNIPDTTTRLRTLWRVHVRQNVGNVACDDPITGFPPPATAARLTNGVSTGVLEEDPCVIAPDGGFRLLENRLLRVEIHKGSSAPGGPTAKWSAENAAVVYGISAINPITLTVGGNPKPGLRLTLKQQARDQFLSLRVNDLVEIVSGEDEIRGHPGVLGTVHTRVSDTVYDVLLNAGETVPAAYTASPLPQSLYTPSLVDFKVRRWDGLITDMTTATDLGNTGVSITFPTVGLAHSGDYWVFAGRTANVASAAESLEKLTNAAPKGVQRHYARLALIQWNGGTATVVDCRPKFPPLTDMVELHYVSGDGQEARPGQPIQPLVVRASNGGIPLENVEVSFAPGVNSGTVTPASPMKTDAHGLASVNWTLSANVTHYRQQVTAALVDNPDIKVIFNANLSVASEVAYNPAKCSNLAGAQTVQDAIDILCQTKGGGCCVCVGKGGDYERLDEALKDLLGRGERDICICLLHGDQEMGGMEIATEPGELDLNIEITGCGPGSRVTLHKPLSFTNVKSVALRDFAIEIAFIVGTGAGALTFDHCAEVTLRECRITGFTADGKGALLSIVNADRVRLADGLFEALLPDSLAPTRNVFQAVAQETGVDMLAKLYSLPDQGEFRLLAFRQVAQEMAQSLAALNIDIRKKAQAALEQAISTPEQRALQSLAENISYAKLQLLLGADVMNPATVFDLLLDIRRSAVKTRPGAAVVLERPRRVDESALPTILPNVDVLDQDDIYLVENNDIAGILSLYGLPAPIAAIDELLNSDILGTLSGRLKENQVRLSNSFLGTLQLRNNQIARVGVAVEIVQELRAAAGAQQSVTFAFDLFGRCQWGDNVFESGRSVLVCRHLTLHADEFTQSAQPQGTVVIGPSVVPALVATVVADSALYVANHSIGNATLRNLSRLMDQAVNQELTIS